MNARQGNLWIVSREQELVVVYIAASDNAQIAVCQTMARRHLAAQFGNKSSTDRATRFDVGLHLPAFERTWISIVIEC